MQHILMQHIVPIPYKFTSLAAAYINVTPNHVYKILRGIGKSPSASVQPNKSWIGALILGVCVCGDAYGHILQLQIIRKKE
jgi:hypothetical protein